MKEFNFIEKPRFLIEKSNYPKIDSVWSQGDPYDESVIKDFFDFSKGAPLSNEEKQEYLNKVIDYFNVNPNAQFTYVGTGNCIIIAFNYVDEIEVMVVEKYMSATIIK